jgi:hypothetical protein
VAISPDGDARVRDQRRLELRVGHQRGGAPYGQCRGILAGEAEQTTGVPGGLERKGDGDARGKPEAYFLEGWTGSSRDSSTDLLGPESPHQRSRKLGSLHGFGSTTSP